MSWQVGYTPTGRLVHAVNVDPDEGQNRTWCGHTALKHTFGPWEKRNEDMLWCLSCDRALPRP